MLSDWKITPICPSISRSSIETFLKFKHWKVGTLLIDDDGAAICDRNGNQIECEGSWNSPENMNQFLVAMSVLHAANGQDGEYMEPCNGRYIIFH